MPALPSPLVQPDPGQLAALRAQVASTGAVAAPVLSFGIADLDGGLADGGLHGGGLHEIAAASAALSDDAAATLFAAALAARFSRLGGLSTLWALTRFDLYAPGIAQAGLAPGQVFYAQGGKDSDVLALAEDGLRDGSLACVIAEEKAADQTATRRLRWPDPHAALPAPPIGRSLPVRGAIGRDDALAYRLPALGAATGGGPGPGPLVGRARPSARRQSLHSGPGGMR